MPKLAATLASLILIASSIGVNIARYPNVGRTAEPGSASAVEPATSPAPASGCPASESPATSQTQPVDTPDRDMPAAKADAAPATETPSPPAQEPQQGEQSPLVQAGRPAADVQADTVVPITDVRPMAPVGNLTGSSGDLPRAGEIRRLPPVDFAASTVTDFGPVQSLSTSAYPRTSTP